MKNRFLLGKIKFKPNSTFIFPKKDVSQLNPILVNNLTTLLIKNKYNYHSSHPIYKNNNHNSHL
jgi:hypothetical protein